MSNNIEKELEIPIHELFEKPEKYYGSWRDRAWCGSENCRNECGRKMPQELIDHIREHDRISYCEFCDEDGNARDNNG